MNGAALSDIDARQSLAARRVDTTISAILVFAVIVAGAASSWASILASPVQWVVVMVAMVLCSMLSVRVSSIDPLATVGISSAMIGVLSPSGNVLSLLFIWSLGALIGFVIRRRTFLLEVRRIARLIPAATVYIVIWLLVAPDPNAEPLTVVLAATLASLGYFTVGIIVASATARLRGYSPAVWASSLRFDLVAAMALLTIVLCLVARAGARLLEDAATTENADVLLTIESSMVLAVLGASAFAVDAFIEATVARSRLDGLIETAAALPWPDEQDRVALAVAFASSTVRSDHVVVEDAAVHSTGAISAPLRFPSGEVKYLVARRQPGRATFIDLDRAALLAVANIAAESMRSSSVVTTLEAESQTDLLTGLANYRGLQSAVDVVRATRRKGQGIAAIYIDMDGFKQINDHYGHDAGNEVLRLIADRMRTIVRPGDVVARVGGDEFLVLLRDIDGPERAEAVGERLRRGASAALPIGGTTVPIRFSYGIAFSNDDSVDPAALIDRADRQMYRARGLRPDSDEGGIDDGSEPEINIDLPKAVSQALDDGSLLVHYQPIVDAGSGMVTAVEALVRCPNPEVGWIPAPLLVREARRLGRASDLTAIVMRQAFLDAERIGNSSGPMHVNVDLDEIDSDTFQVLVDDLRAAHPGVRLLLELGEESLHRTTPEGIARLTAMRDRGVLIALDDFGKAHSTMLAIAQLPVDVIKVDQSMVQGIEDPASQHLLRSLDRLAKRLLIRVVVEGVETERDREILTSLGIAEMQGYVFARPMPVDELITYIADAARTAFASWTTQDRMIELDDFE